jgi:hypothetical protein
VPALPPEPVLPDDSWGACQEQATPEGKIAIAAQFVSRGTEMRDGAPMEKIEANYVFSAEKEKEKEVALEFTDQENRGVFHFDAAAGRLMRGEIRQSMTLRLRVEESEVSQKAKGAMTIEIRPQAGQGTR